MRRLLKEIRKLVRTVKAYPRNKKIVLASALLVVVFLAYILISLVTIDRSDIHLAALRTSYQQEFICREKCLLARRQHREAIIKALNKDSRSSLSRRMGNYFQDESETFDFRCEIALIWREVESGNPPNYIVNYFNSSTADPRLLARLMSLFDPGVLLVDDSNYSSPLDYYFSLLESSEDIVIYEAALRGISSYLGKEGKLTAGQIDLLKDLILDSETDTRLRPLLVMLLGDNYEAWPDAVSEIMKLAYSETDIDEVSRYLVADLLNRYENGGGPEEGAWPWPEVSPAAWSKYYER